MLCCVLFTLASLRGGVYRFTICIQCEGLCLWFVFCILSLCVHLGFECAC